MGLLSSIVEDGIKNDSKQEKQDDKKTEESTPLNLDNFLKDVSTRLDQSQVSTALEVLDDKNSTNIAEMKDNGSIMHLFSDMFDNDRELYISK